MLICANCVNWGGDEHGSSGDHSNYQAPVVEAEVVGGIPVEGAGGGSYVSGKSGDGEDDCNGSPVSGKSHVFPSLPPRQSVLELRWRHTQPRAAELKRAQQKDPIVEIVSEILACVKGLCDVFVKEGNKKMSFLLKLQKTNERIDKLGAETNNKLDELKELLVSVAKRN